MSSGRQSLTKCLTPIEDDPDIWTKVEFGENDPIQHFQCKRMSSLFKDVAEDGTVRIEQAEYEERKANRIDKK